MSVPCLFATPNPAHLLERAQGLLIPESRLTAPVPERAHHPWSPSVLTVAYSWHSVNAACWAETGSRTSRVPVRRRALVRQPKAGKHLSPVAQGHVTSSPGRVQQNRGWYRMEASPLEQGLSNLPASHSLALVFSSLKWGQECQSQNALVSITCIHLYKTHCTEFNKWQL